MPWQGCPPAGQVALGHVPPGLLNAPKGWASIASLGGLFQCLTTIWVENFLLTSNLCFQCFSLKRLGWLRAAWVRIMTWWCDSGLPRLRYWGCTQGGTLGTYWICCVTWSPVSMDVHGLYSRIKAALCLQGSLISSPWSFCFSASVCWKHVFASTFLAEM